MTNPFYNYTDGVPISGSRGIASVIQSEFTLLGTGFDLVDAMFPNLSIPVTVTSAEINYLTGVTSNVQTQINAKAAIAGQAYTGAHDFTGGSVTVPTATVGTSTTQAASTAFVVATSLVSTLPGQVGNAGKFISTDGTNAQWTAINPVTVVSGTTQTAVANNHYILTNVAATTVTLPASPASGDTVWITVTNSLTTNVIARNGQTIMGVSEDMTIDNANATVELRFVNSSWRLV